MALDTEIEKLIDRKTRPLKIAVVVLSILFVFSIFVSIYAVSQITMLSNKIPSYTEVKEDIKFLKGAYLVTEKKVDSLHITDKVVKGYDYTVDKAGDLVNYLKEQKDKRYGK